MQWNSKQILFPENLIFSTYGEEEVDYQIPHSNFKKLF